MNIRLYKPSDRVAWDAYVANHPKSTNCHLAGWKDVIERTYKHKGHYLVAEEGSKLVGILPLIQIKSRLFGNQMVSMPFLNYGGALADDEVIQKYLIFEAAELGSRLKVNNLELRYLDPVWTLNESNSDRMKNLFVKTEKVRMLMELPSSSETLFQSFKAKLRSQINRPIKEGMDVAIGGHELIEEFYKVFCVNMRDLGSPVHSKSLFQHLLDSFATNARIFAVRYQGLSVAVAIVVCFRDTVEVPWASSLRTYNSLSPNMLLYWALLKFASDQRYKYFDFGRSTPGEGTAKFKEQWGAKPRKLYWYSIGAVNKRQRRVDSGSKDSMQLAEAVWRRIPLFLANTIGPRIRAGIPL